MWVCDTIYDTTWQTPVIIHLPSDFAICTTCLQAVCQSLMHQTKSEECSTLSKGCFTLEEIEEKTRTQVCERNKKCLRNMMFSPPPHLLMSRQVSQDQSQGHQVVNYSCHLEGLFIPNKHKNVQTDKQKNKQADRQAELIHYAQIIWFVGK